MSSLITNATIRHREDTAGNWTSNNPTPASGELCYETDTKKLKIGDGSTAWTSLAYSVDTAAVTASIATKATLSTYTAGWVANSDWTNAELTSNHALATNLSELIVKVFVSSGGTDATAIEVFGGYDASGTARGWNIYQVDINNIKVQTGTGGVLYLSDSGTPTVLGAATSWYYKIVVYKLS